MNNNLKQYTFNELSIEPTHKCSLNCIYCSSKGGLEKATNINLERIKQIILETKKEFKLKAISMSGGESFLYPEFWDLFEFITDNELEVIIYTSGVLLEKENKLSPISKEDLSKMKSQQENIKIIMNIQGHNKNLIEMINRTKGSYKIINKSINNVISQNIFLGANIVPFKYNFKCLEEIVKYCEDKSFNEVNFLRFVPQGRGRNRDLYNSKKEFAEIIKVISKLLCKHNNEKSKFNIRIGHPMNFLFLKNYEYFNKDEDFHYCRGGLDAPLILPDGEVSMCPAWKDLKKFSAGNIYKESFKEIWDSDYFKIFRKFIKRDYKNINEPCKSCEYLEECRGKCVAQRLLNQNITNNISLEELIYYAPDPQCFKRIVKK